jgi:glutathione S-transferase
MWEDSTSPFSAKMRVFLHYKQIPYVSMRTTGEVYMVEIPKLVGAPIIPVILTPNSEVMQDTTPMMQWFEAEHPEPASVPDDPRLEMLHWLVEDFADEYMTRLSMHYRWGNELNRETLSRRIGRNMAYGAPQEIVDTTTQMILSRQTGFDDYLALNDETRPDLDAQLLELLAILEEHFLEHQYLFGGRPSVADFALYGQLFAHLWADPFSARIMEVHGSQTCIWLEHITQLGDTRGARGQTDFGHWLTLDDGLPDTLRRLLAFIGSTYVPLSAATARASVKREKRVKATIRGIEAEFSVHHYRAWAFEEIQRRFAALGESDRAYCERVFVETGVQPGLMADGILHNALYDGLTPPFVVNGEMDNRIKHRNAKRRG